MVAVTKQKGMVAAAMMRIPGGTTRRGPSRSVIAPDFRIMRAAPMPCGAMSRPACHGLSPRDLVVERQYEHGAVQGGAQDEYRDVGDGEVAVSEQAQVEERMAYP